jgi:hypothetical protein
MLKVVGFMDTVRVPKSRKEYFIISENASANTLNMKINSYAHLQAIINDGIASLKKIGKPVKHLEDIIIFTNMQKKRDEELLISWKKYISVERNKKTTSNSRRKNA